MPGRDEMRPAISGVKLTYDDFLQFPDDGKRHELIDGKHYVTATPNTKHQRICGNLFFLIRSYLEDNPIGEVFGVPLDIVLSNSDIVEPDVQYLSKARATSVLTPKHLIGAPELIVEIGSPSTRKRDLTIKRRLYERFGVEEYWTVDPELNTIAVYRLAGGRYQRVAELTREAGDVLTTPLLPGLEMPLAKIFKE